MQQNTAPSREQITIYLDQLNVAKAAYDLAETNWNFVITKRLPQEEVKEAFFRRKATSEHYIEISQWLLLNTPHGLIYDEETGIFNLR